MSFTNTSRIFLFLFLLLPSLLMAASAVVDEQAEEDDDDEDEFILYDDTLPWAKDLAAEAQQAACNSKPLILMFGSSECPYCSIVRALYMVPLPEEKRYSGIVVREIEIDSNTEVKDFSGKNTTMRKLAESYGVYLVPTVMVLGTDGKQVGKSIVGLSNEDFYGFYLDQAIVAGTKYVKKLSANGAPSVSPGAYVCG